MTILIPAYEPDTRLLKLIDEIKAVGGFNILIVDDGSGSKYSGIFNSAREKGCKVLTHPVNKGKGSALKTGFKYIKESGDTDGVVCADCDGQHRPEDIVMVAKRVNEYKKNIIMGCRHFVGRVPVRSRFGNAVTRMIYAFATGNRIYDTQTGLRGFSPDMLDWLCSISGERFEYEMNMLLEAKDTGYGFHEVEIDTIYYKGNKSSHFRSVADSFRVYIPIIKFSLSSMLSSLLDFVLLFAIRSLTSNLLISAVGARIFSSVFNYSFNKRVVFSKGRNKVQKSLLKYYTLAVTIMALNYLLLSLLNEQIGIPLFGAKLLAELILFLFSYWSQHRFVFKNEAPGNYSPSRT